jgi:hypothetical protein
MRFRWANSISTFFRCRRELQYAHQAEIATNAPSARSRCGERRAGPGGVRVPDPHYLTGP